MMTTTGNTGGTIAGWAAFNYYDEEVKDIKRSNSAYRGWCTRYRKEIALLKKEQIDLRMEYDNHVNHAPKFTHAVVSGF